MSLDGDQRVKTLGPVLFSLLIHPLNSLMSPSIAGYVDFFSLGPWDGVTCDIDIVLAHVAPHSDVTSTQLKMR